MGRKERREREQKRENFATKRSAEMRIPKIGIEYDNEILQPSDWIIQKIILRWEVDNTMSQH